MESSRQQKHFQMWTEQGSGLYICLPCIQLPGPYAYFVNRGRDLGDSHGLLDSAGNLGAGIWAYDPWISAGTLLEREAPEVAKGREMAPLPGELSANSFALQLAVSSLCVGLSCIPRISSSSSTLRVSPGFVGGLVLFLRLMRHLAQGW